MIDLAWLTGKHMVVQTDTCYNMLASAQRVVTGLAAGSHQRCTFTEILSTSGQLIHIYLID